MRRIAVLALCLLSSLASAKDIEEVVVTARQFRVILLNIQDTHKYNPITRRWYYDAQKEAEAMKKAEEERRGV